MRRSQHATRLRSNDVRLLHDGGAALATPKRAPERGPAAARDPCCSPAAAQHGRALGTGCRDASQLAGRDGGVYGTLVRLIEIWGTLSFTGGAGQAWLSHDVAIGAQADWPAALTGDAPGGTVRELLDQYGHEDPDGTYLRITPGFPWKIGGIVREEWFRDTGRALVALFCSAAAAGAKGEVSFASDDDDVRFRVKVEGGASKVSVPSEKGVRRAADEKARAALAATIVRPAASSAGLDVASLQRAVVDALEAVPEATLREAIQLHAPNHMRQWWLASKPQIIESMRAGWHLGFLLLYLAHANPAAAEPLALRALAADDMEVRQRALSALGLVGKAAAVDRLLAELTAPVPPAGYAKSAHLGANWGLRHVRDPGLRAVIAKAASEYASRKERHPDIERLFAAIVAHHQTALAHRRGALPAPLGPLARNRQPWTSTPSSSSVSSPIPLPPRRTGTGTRSASRRSPRRRLARRSPPRWSRQRGPSSGTIRRSRGAGTEPGSSRG